MDPTPRTVLVVAGGDAVDPSVDRRLPPPGAVTAVVAADSGIDVALALGRRVDVAVGDFDSVSARGLQAVETAGARVQRHPRDKDATDLALALDEAVAMGATDVVVVGGDGGRRDHLLGGVLVCAGSPYADVRLVMHLGPAVVDVVRPHQPLAAVGQLGELVSLLPVHGDAMGVRTAGLRYPLRGEDLPAGTSRGISNVIAAPAVEVTLQAGTLLVVRPGVVETEESEPMEGVSA